jgi:cardiolipin synthase
LERLRDAAQGSSDGDATDRILTIPNVITSIRLLLIPAYVALILDPHTRQWGILLMVAVMSTDWVDGYVARRSGQVSEVGKILDPMADRIAIAAALIALVIAGVFPLWAALLVILRDALVLGAAIYLMRRGTKPVPVRWIGKSATFTLMLSIPLIAWGESGFALAHAALAVGWTGYSVGIAEYYWATYLYAKDIRRLREADLRENPEPEGESRCPSSPALPAPEH